MHELLLGHLGTLSFPGASRYRREEDEHYFSCLWLELNWTVNAWEVDGEAVVSIK